MPRMRLEALSIRAEMSADDNSVGNVYINGPITFWAWEGFNETDAVSVRKALKAVENATTLNVYIDSPGGYLDEAMTMMREISEHKADTKNAYLMECASAATLLALPCHHVSIYEGGEVMIHNPRAHVSGTPKEIIHAGEGLQKRADSVAELYSHRMNKSVQEIQAMMDAETWMTPSEALDCGFAHEIIPIVPGSGVTMCAGDEKARRARMGKLLGYSGQGRDGGCCHMDNTQTSAHLGTGNGAAPSAANSNRGNNRKDEAKMTMEELKKESPELYQQIFDAGRMEGERAERARMQALDDLYSEEHAQMIHDAKYGENPGTAEKVAVQIVMSQRGKQAQQMNAGQSYLNKRKTEAGQMAKVEGGAAQDNNPEADDEKEIAAFAKMAAQYAGMM